MAIFKKASVTPIVRSVISQGIEDDRLYFDDKYSTTDEDKIKSMFKEVYNEGYFDAALSIADYYFDGYSYDQIRSLVRINYKS